MATKKKQDDGVQEETGGMRKFSKMKTVLWKGWLSLPTMGTSLGILGISSNGSKNQIPLRQVPFRKMIALVHNCQQQFEIAICNKSCPRDLMFNVEIHQIQNLIQANKLADPAFIRTIQHRKLKILPQSSPEAQNAIQDFASKHQITHQAAAKVMSQMEFYISYAERLPQNLFQIHVRYINTGEVFSLQVTNQDTIVDVKCQIYEQMDVIPENQKLVYGGHVLINDQTIESCNISRGTRLCLLTVNNCPIGDLKKDSAEPQIQPADTTIPDIFAHQHYLEPVKELLTKLKEESGGDSPANLGERGIIVLGEETETNYRIRRYECDQTTHIKPIKIEFRVLRDDDLQ